MKKIGGGKGDKLSENNKWGLACRLESRERLKSEGRGTQESAVRLIGKNSRNVT